MAGILPGKKRIDKVDALGGTAVDRPYLHNFSEFADVKNEAAAAFDTAGQNLVVRAAPPASLLLTLQSKATASAAAEQGYTAGGPGRYYQLLPAVAGLDALEVRIPAVDAVLSPQALSGFAMELRNKLGGLENLPVTEIKEDSVGLLQQPATEASWIRHVRKLGVIYFPTNWGAKEPQNLPNHRVVRLSQPGFKRFLFISNTVDASEIRRSLTS